MEERVRITEPGLFISATVIMAAITLLASLDNALEWGTVSSSSLTGLAVLGRSAEGIPPLGGLIVFGLTFSVMALFFLAIAYIKRENPNVKVEHQIRIRKAIR